MEAENGVELSWSVEMPNDVLRQCLARLEDPRDLLAAGQACRRWQAVAAPHSELWRSLCTRRWGQPLHARLFSAPAAAPTDWRALFVEEDGWQRPRLSCEAAFAGRSWDDELAAVQLCPGAGPDQAAVAVASTRHLQLLELGGAGGEARLRPTRGCALPREAPALSSVATVDSGAGLLACGTCTGAVQLFQLPARDGRHGIEQRAAPAATLSLPDTRAIVTQLQHVPGPGEKRLLALHDSLAHLAPQSARACFSLVNASTLQLLATGTELLDGYELAAVAAADAHEVLAGSVKLSDDQLSGWPCSRCHAGAHASLCFHQGRSSGAALCVFDPRAGHAMVQRFGLGHRSLYPHLLPLRGHYLATSHAGTPVALWDRRQMSAPVHEVQHLPSGGPGGDVQQAWEEGLPLPAPECTASTQAMHLSATLGDGWLLGRQDNGMCWLWDLSERLGWADGSRRGAWLRSMLGSGGEGAEDSGTSHMDETDWDAAPLALGCLPAPYECWARAAVGPGHGPLHWLPPAPAWVAGPGLVAIVGLELEEKQELFPAHAQGATSYPSNAVSVCCLRR